MRALTLSLAVLVLLVVWGAPIAHADKGDPYNTVKKLFAEGNDLARAGKHAEALLKYEAALKIEPEAKGPLFNGGLSAYMVKRYDVAILFWTRLKAITPEDAQVRAKLVQAYAASGKTKERDGEIEALYVLRKETDDPELKALRFFCREQFEVGKKKVMVFEHFEWVGERAIKWYFAVIGEKKGKQEYHLSLGAYAYMQSFMKDQLKPGQKYCHLDGYYPGGVHATHGMYKGLPSYDDMRARVVEIVAGKSKPLSSSKPGGGDEKEEKKEDD